MSESTDPSAVEIEATPEEAFDYMVTPFQERMARILPVPYAIAWLIFCQLLFLADFLIVRFYEADANTLLPSLALIAVICGEAVAVVRASKLLERFARALLTFALVERAKLLQWYNDQLRKVFEPKYMAATGGLFIIILLVPMFVSQGIPWRQSWPGRIMLQLIFVLVAFGGGAMFYCLVRIALLVVAIGRLPLRIAIHQHPAASIGALGTVLFKITLGAVGVFAVGLIAWVLIEGIDPTARKGLIAIIWPLVFGLFLIGYAIFPQIGVHDLMAKAKFARIRKFSAHVENALQRVTDEPSSENIRRLNELFQVERELNGMREWPFDTKTLLLFLGSVVVPIAITILNVILRVPGKD